MSGLTATIVLSLSFVGKRPCRFLTVGNINIELRTKNPRPYRTMECQYLEVRAVF